MQGNQGAAGLRATLEGLRIPGPKPDLLAGAPVVLQADARLDDPPRPVTFSLSHPLLQAKGTANTGGDITAHVDLTAPDLQPLAAAGGVDLQGRTQLAVDAAMAGGATTVKLDGTLRSPGAWRPCRRCWGMRRRSARRWRCRAATSRSAARRWTGSTLRLDASGTDQAGVLDARYKVALADLAVLAPTVEGAATLTGTAKGPTDDLAVAAALDGEVGAKGVPRGPVQVAVNATGLPGQARRRRHRAGHAGGRAAEPGAARRAVRRRHAARHHLPRRLEEPARRGRRDAGRRAPPCRTARSACA